MKMKEIARAGLAFVLLIGFLGCASTIDQRGKDFTYKPGIVIGKTTKREIQETYGHPTASEIKGKYEILRYSYSKESLKHGRTIGMGLLSAVPVVGLATLAMDQGVQESEMAREYRLMTIYTELSTGIVRDFFYHDSDGKGQDESETLLLKGWALLKQGKNQEGIQALEQSISLNPNNHRALNALAWTLIDFNIDVGKGVAFADRAVKVFLDSPYNNGTLGCGYYKKGDLARAEEYLTAAIKLFPVYAPQDQKGIAHDKAILQSIREQRK